jgi:hemoglobin/transferrin/lactoferrin receptor protein
MKHKASISFFTPSVCSVTFCVAFSVALAGNVSANAIEAGTESEIETITVTGTKTARKINEIAATVTTINSQQIDALGATNIRDLLRYEPGISVEGSGRYGLSSFNIRGITGDRVLILVDNIPIADEFSFGPNLSARRDFVDVDLIKSVDIVRGPASTLYGSDAIGGVVAFTTKDPIDIVTDGESFAGRTKIGYVSQSSESYVNAMLAGVGGDWQWLVNSTYRDGNETQSFYNDASLGDTRTSADPQDNDSLSLLTKLIYQKNDAHRLKFIAETFEQTNDTQLLSEVGTQVRGTITLSSLGFDQQERSRFSAEYLYQPSGAHHLKRVNMFAFYQNSSTEQASELVRQSLGPEPSPFFRTRDSMFEQSTVGLHAQFDHQFEWGGQHYLIYGLSTETTESEGLREGQTQDQATSSPIPEFSVFPARDFPLSTLSEQSIFIQDEIQFLDGRLLLSPGLRYDRFKLSPESDRLFETANPGVEVSSFKDSQLSKKLGAIYSLSESYNIWLQYAEGFRIPPMDDVNVGFTNFAGRYTSLSNPDLKPESVTSLELGIRGFTDALTWSISAYQNKYTDFIESLTFVGINPNNGFIQFQAVNVDDVEIKGIEGQVVWSLGDTFSRALDWQIRASYSIQDSENKATGNDLESIAPNQAVFGLQYKDYSDPWRIEVAASYTEEAQALTSAGATPFFVAPSYTTIDILGHLKITPNIKINAGIFNATNKQYWLASEVRGQSAEDNLLPFTSPERNYSVNVVVQF